MKRNLANWERFARISAGLAAAAAGVLLLEPLWLQAVVGLSGVGFSLTGAAARCPVCHVAGIGTYKGHES
ncbi:MAG: YgaP family membrane protein [Nannocystales bacterium]